MSALSVADVLDRAADLIEPEGKWTQGAFAREKTGRPINAFDRKAVCFCMKGAVGVCGGTGAESLAIVETLPPSKTCPIATFNDAPERTQAEVVAKLREASALAREQGL